MSISVFIADDHTVVRDGLRLLIETQSDMKVVSEASNGREAARQVLRTKPGRGHYGSCHAGIKWR